MREVRDSFQPYLMASGQSMEVSWKVLGGAGAKSDLRRIKEKVGGRRSGESPEFLTKGQFQRGGEGLQSMLWPRVVVESGEKDDGLEGGHHLTHLRKETRDADKAPPHTQE